MDKRVEYEKWKGREEEFEPFQSYLDLSSKRFIEESVTDEMLKMQASKVLETLSVSQMNFIGEVWPEYYEYLREDLPVKIRMGIRRGFDILLVKSIYIIT